MTLDLMELHNLSTLVRRVVADARKAGVVIDAGNIVDLTADNLGHELDELRDAIALCPELPQPVGR